MAKSSTRAHVRFPALSQLASQFWKASIRLLPLIRQYAEEINRNWPHNGFKDSDALAWHARLRGAAKGRAEANRQEDRGASRNGGRQLCETDGLGPGLP